MNLMTIDQRRKKFNQGKYELFVHNSTFNALISLFYESVIFQLKRQCVTFNSLLDIGSHRGQFTNVLKRELNIKEVECVDVSSISVEEGKKLYPDLKFHCVDVLNFKTDHKFDLVLSFNSLYYVTREERKTLIRKISTNFVNPKGYVLVGFGDANFTEGADNVVKQLEVEFGIVNIIKVLEKIPVKSHDPQFHSTMNMWYTSVLMRPK